MTDRGYGTPRCVPKRQRVRDMAYDTDRGYGGQTWTLLTSFSSTNYSLVLTWFSSTNYSLVRGADLGALGLV